MCKVRCNHCWRIIKWACTDLKYHCDSVCARIRNMERGNNSKRQFLKWLNTQPYLEKVWKCSDWQARCPLQLPHGTPGTPLSLRKQECEEKWEKPQPIFVWPSGSAPLSLSLSHSARSPFFIKKKHMYCRGIQVWNSILIPQTVFLLKPLLSRQAGGPGQPKLGSAHLCGYILYKEGGDREY